MSWRASRVGICHAFAKRAHVSVCGWERRADSRTAMPGDLTCGACQRLSRVGAA